MQIELNPDNSIIKGGIPYDDNTSDHYRSGCACHWYTGWIYIEKMQKLQEPSCISTRTMLKSLMKKK